MNIAILTMEAPSLYHKAKGIKICILIHKSFLLKNYRHFSNNMESKWLTLKKYGTFIPQFAKFCASTFKCQSSSFYVILFYSCFKNRRDGKSAVGRSIAGKSADLMGNLPIDKTTLSHKDLSLFSLPVTCLLEDSLFPLDQIKSFCVSFSVTAF